MTRILLLVYGHRYISDTELHCSLILLSRIVARSLSTSRLHFPWEQQGSGKQSMKNLLLLYSCPVIHHLFIWGINKKYNETFAYRSRTPPYEVYQKGSSTLDRLPLHVVKPAWAQISLGWVRQVKWKAKFYHASFHQGLHLATYTVAPTLASEICLGQWEQSYSGLFKGASFQESVLRTMLIVTILIVTHSPHSLALYAGCFQSQAMPCTHGLSMKSSLKLCTERTSTSEEFLRLT